MYEYTLYSGRSAEEIEALTRHAESIGWIVYPYVNINNEFFYFSAKRIKKG